MPNIVLTDAKMKILQSVRGELQTLGNILVNVKNGDMLESAGKIVDRLPYGELP